MDEKPLLHEYDPAKRRAYYLKTRMLKGHMPAATRKTTPRRKAAPKPPAKTRAQRQAERRKKQEAQIEALKARLEKLRKVLAAEVKKAQAKSGQKTAASQAKKADNKSSSKAPKLSAKQKADAAKRAEEYREKNEDELLADELKSLTAKIKTIQERIAKMRTKSSKGARGSTSK